MPLYRKRPVVIEAQHLTDDSYEKVVEWMRYNGAQHLTADSHACTIMIHTLEGDMIAIEDDWIIKGVAGEFYPCKDEIFQDSYEVPEPDAPSSAQGPNNDRTAIAFECAKACDSDLIKEPIEQAIQYHDDLEDPYCPAPNADDYYNAIDELYSETECNNELRKYFLTVAALAILAIETIDKEPK